MIQFQYFIFLIAPTSFLLLRLLSRTSLLQIILKCSRNFRDRFHVYQLYRIPQFRDDQYLQENQLYRKVSAYLNSSPAVEDSNFANLLSGAKPNEIFLRPDADQAVADVFLGARVFWTNEKSESSGGIRFRSFVLRIRKRDKRRILRPYLQHILSAAEEVERSRKEIRLFVNAGAAESRWMSVPFSHPATFETVAMDGEVKSKVRSDLEQFLKSKQYYHRLGRVWRRSYLLCGPSGTGKSSFAAAMARFLCYDVYDIDLSRVSSDADLRTLLLRTANRSVILIEDLDRFLIEKSTAKNNREALSLSGLLNFMDGIESCCGEERVMVYTMNGSDRVDRAVLRPGRIDVHVQFTNCDFSLFKSLAGSYLGVKEHKYFDRVEEIFQTGASLSPAEVGEIMISNRSSPTRAMKSVISALQVKGGRRLSEARLDRRLVHESVEPTNVFCRESVHPVKEFRKLYGLLRMGSRKQDDPLDSAFANENEGGRQDT